MATYIPQTGPQQDVFPTNGKKFTLKEVQKLVGGYIAPIKLGDGSTMYVDEDGFMKGLPANDWATTVYRRTYGHAGPNGGIVVGNALVCSPTEFTF